MYVTCYLSDSDSGSSSGGESDGAKASVPVTGAKVNLDIISH